MRYEYKTENTCAQIIRFDMEDNIVRNIEFFGGCNGNLKAIAKLVDGWPVEKSSKCFSETLAVADRHPASISWHVRCAPPTESSHD